MSDDARKLSGDILDLGGDAKERIASAAHAVSTAVLLLKMEMPTIEAFLKESRDMDNFGHITSPTLFRDPTRRAVNAIVEPLFKAAVAFVAVYEEQIAASKAALEKISR